jgi:predicted enzyme related to lactoylglutathione lyase
MNNVAYFEIQADDPQKAAAFYTAVFGWKCTIDPSLPIEYLRVEGGGPFGGILKRPVPVPSGPAGTNAYVCSMQVENFDQTAEKIMAEGGIVAMPKFAVVGKCWQGYFQDPAGNTFGIFQTDTTAA